MRDHDDVPPTGYIIRRSLKWLAAAAVLLVLILLAQPEQPS